MKTTIKTRPKSTRQEPVWITYLIPRLGDVLFVVLLIGVFVIGIKLLNGDGDLGRHITIGAYILDNRQIPTVDLFSHTMLGQPLTPHEWLAQVIFAAAYRWQGLDGVVFLCALLLALTVGLVYNQCLQRSGWILLSLALALLATAVTTIHWLARPHLWTMLLVVLWAGVLGHLRQGRFRWVWVLPIIMVIWANLHGAFIAGFMIWVIEGVGGLWESWFGEERLKPVAGWWRFWALGGLLSLAATLLNPSGIGLWQTSIGYIRNRFLVDHTLEYFSPNFHQTSAWPFLLMLALILWLLGMNWMRLRPTGLLMVIGWAAMSLYSARNIPIFALLAAPLLTEGIAELWKNGLATPRINLDGYRRLESRLGATEALLRGRLWPVGAMLVLALMLVMGNPPRLGALTNQFKPEVFPVEAVNWLEQNPQAGNVFNHFPWGGYMLYRMWPQQLVFIDGQTDFYGEALARQYGQVAYLEPGWQDVLKQYDVRWALLPVNASLVEALVKQEGWKIAFKDDLAAILLREDRP